MANRLFLHIGTHKTGTTSIQSFLFENRDNLENLGYTYPMFEAERIKNKANISPDYAKNGNYFITQKYTIDGASANYTSAIQRIKDDLNKYDVIISDENFVLERFLDKILTLLSKEIDNLYIVLYLRRQDLLIESLWNQNIKGGVTSLPFSEYVKECLPDWMDYKYLLEKIEKYVPRENIIVRVYEKEQFFKGNLFSDFLHSIGLNINIDNWKKSKEDNARLNGNYIEIKRIINENNVVDPFPSFSWKEKLTALVDSYEKKDGDLHYFSNEERKLFYSRYYDANKEVAKKMFGRDELFLNNEFEYDLADKPEVLSEHFIKDVIRIFALFVGDLQKRVMELESFKKDSIYRTIVLVSGGRKIYLWGAGNNCRRILKEMPIEVGGIIDSDHNKAGEIILGHRVVAEDEIEDWHNLYIIITPFEYESIEEKLLARDMIKGVNYCVAKELGMIN